MNQHINEWAISVCCLISFIFLLSYMSLQVLHDKDQIHRFLAHNPAYFLYLIGDLDGFFWPHTVWYGWEVAGEIEAIALLYLGPGMPTLLAFHDRPGDAMECLLREVRPYLPQRFLAHVSEGLMTVFASGEITGFYGHNHKMVLRELVPTETDTAIRTLTQADIPAAEALFAQAYPNNWFDPRMLDTGKYFGYELAGELVGIAGIHVYSAQYRVAALGNITTHPDFRQQGISRKLTTRLCADLLHSTEYIGLNVRSENVPAIRMYEAIGFEWIGNYDECKICLASSS